MFTDQYFMFSLLTCCPLKPVFSFVETFFRKYNVAVLETLCDCFVYAMTRSHSQCCVVKKSNLFPDSTTTLTLQGCAVCFLHKV